MPWRLNLYSATEVIELKLDQNFFILTVAFLWDVELVRALFYTSYPITGSSSTTTNPHLTPLTRFPAPQA